MDEPEEIIADDAEEGEGPGPHVIRAHLRTLPNRPGVYRMFDAKGDVLYVGKARSLKNRVASYIRLAGHTSRIAAMISLTANMEFVTTETEAEATGLAVSAGAREQAAISTEPATMKDAENLSISSGMILSPLHDIRRTRNG